MFVAMTVNGVDTGGLEAIYRALSSSHAAVSSDADWSGRSRTSVMAYDYLIEDVMRGRVAHW